MKTTNNIRNTRVKLIVLFAGLLIVNVMFGQGAHPGTDPEGLSVPIDGGILMAILAGGSLVTMMFKKKKKDE